MAVNHLSDYTDLGALSFIPKFGAFEAILGFLLISGYSVTSSYLNKKSGFIIRRVKRLYPIYLGSIVITLFISVYVQGKILPSPFEILLNALFLNQIFTKTSLVGPAWSLSLEFWLYCLLPIISVFGVKNFRVLAYGSFATYLVYTVMRTLFHQPYYSGLGYGLNIIFLAFAWICGSALAREALIRTAALEDIRLMLSIHLAATVLIQLGSRVRRDTLAQFFSADSLNYLMQAFTLMSIYMLLKHISQGRGGVKKDSKVMRVLGDISYPLYLIHIPIYIAASAAGIQSPYGLFVIALTASWLMYAGIDFYSQRRD